MLAWFESLPLHLKQYYDMLYNSTSLGSWFTLAPLVSRYIKYSLHFNKLTSVLRSCTARWGCVMLGVDAAGSAALGVSAPASPPVAIYSTERTPCMSHARYTCSRAVMFDDPYPLPAVTFHAEHIVHPMMACEVTLKQCYNKGCGKKYGEIEDTEGSPYINHQS